MALRRRAALLVTALVALAGAPAPSVAGEAFVPTARPQVEVARAVAVPGGRVVLSVRVRYTVPADRHMRLLPDPSAATHVGRLAVRVSAGGRVLASARDANPLVLASARRKFAFTHRLTLGRTDSARVRAARRARVTVIATEEVRVQGSRRRSAARSLRRSFDAVVRRGPRPAPARPVCETAPRRAAYARVTRLAVVCMGEGVRVRVGRGARRGRVRLLSARGGRALLAYRPRARYVGADSFALRATAAGASAATAGGAATAIVPVSVQPFKLRALGDSVTAGFGFLSDGSEMGDFQLPSCIPPDVPNDRCSSNSPNGPGQDGPVGWLPDFGLGNGVAWPAQFAREVGLTGPGQYANYAVAGSTPQDWDTGGYLNGTLAEIAADNPGLVVLTLGANPLLDAFLFGGGVSCAVTSTDAQLTACVQSYIDQARLVPRLQSVLGALLASPGTNVVVSQYHQAIPATAPFTVHQLRIMFGVVNLNIRQAVRAVDGFGIRLLLMAPPAFNVGLPPGSSLCPGGSGTVDGPSRQARISQDELEADHPFAFCGSTEYWIISPDTGIHPNQAGHAQFAYALGQLAQAYGLVPPLP
jgi:lysophospholipase L1-like esterase